MVSVKEYVYIDPATSQIPPFGTRLMTHLRAVYRAVLLFSAAFFVLATCAERARAQGDAPTNEPPAAPTPPKPFAPEGLFLEGVTLAPHSRPRAGRPLTVVAMARNTSSIARSAIAVAKLNSDPDFQAATYVEIPAHSNRWIELRLRVPESAQTAIEFGVSLNDPNNPAQVLLGAGNTPLLDERRMTLTTDWLVTALAMKAPAPPLPDWSWPHDDTSMPYEFVVAARADSSHSRRTVTIDHVNLPSQIADWQTMDEIVISSDRVFHDEAVVGSMNRWIAGGGRAWVMIDEIDPVHIRRILSDGMSCERLDDIDLNRFVVETTSFSQLKEVDRTVVSEKPVHFRRVVQTGGEVTISIDKYPVAIWYRVGKGMVLLTTLAPEGWLEPRTSQRKSGEEYETTFQLRVWAAPMAERLHEPKPMTSPIDVAEVQYALQQIGNPVLNRSYVLSIVFGFCVLLCAVAGICRLTNHMLRLVWLVPLISLAASAPLVIASIFQRREIPDTSAHLQLIEVQPGSQTIQATQWTACYMSHAHQDKLSGEGDAVVSWPSASGQLDLRRWTWLDYGKWELTSSGWPSGIWQLKSRYAMPTTNLDAVARIDEQGLQIRLPGQLKHALSDAVVQYSPGNPAPCGKLELDKSNRIPELHLSQADSWITESLVDDEQRRREQVYRQMQAVAGQPGFPSYPAVIGWTELWPGPVAWSQSRDERGAALVVLPIKLLPTAGGQRVHVPHSVIRVSNANRAGSLSTAFSNSSGWWREPTTLPATVSLRCTLPKQVCPIKATEISCQMQIRAPQRKAILTATLPDGQSKPIKEFVSPTATQTVSIVDPMLLDELRDGVIDFQLEITPEISQIESPLGDQQAVWQVDYFRISVEGQVESR